MTMISPPAQYIPLYVAASNKSGVPYDILVAQGLQESGFNPDPPDGGAGALGIAQFEPSTITWLQSIGVLPANFNPLDPTQAIPGQAAYMAYLLHLSHGSIEQALSGYNAGPGELLAYLDPTFGGGQTYNYVKDILANAPLVVYQTGVTVGEATYTGPTGASTTSITAASDTDAGELGPQFTQDLPKVSLKYTSPLSILDITFQGTKLTEELVQAFTTDGSTVDWTCNEVGQVTLVFQDPGFNILRARANVFVIGAHFGWDEFDLIIAAIEVNQGPAAEQFIITGRSAGVYALKQKIGAYNFTQNQPQSSSQVMQTVCQEANIAIVAQQCVEQLVIQRNNLGYDPNGQTIPESSWDMGQRLALDEGFIAFECGGVYYFGEPTWLVSILPVVPIGWRGSAGTDLLNALECPDCSMDVDSEIAKFTWSSGLPTDPTWLKAPKQIQLKLDRWLGEQVRPGIVIDLSGVPGFEDLYLVTECTFPIDGGVEPAEITAISAVDPTPAEPEGRQNPDSPTSTGIYETPTPQPGTSLQINQPTVTSKTHTNLEFVHTAEMAIAKVPYVWGGKDPGGSLASAISTGLDCSGLVQWAASRLGIRLPEGSQQQFEATTNNGANVLSLSQALATKGALLFYNDPGEPLGYDHVQISLGDGVHAVAETQTGTLASIVVATGESDGGGANFSGGGLIPGLNYGSGRAS